MSVKATSTLISSVYPQCLFSSNPICIFADDEPPHRGSKLGWGRVVTQGIGVNRSTTFFTFYTFSIMAKGNMFQGMARGKVGDVVFSRLNGEQISRVRNRHPKNPRSNAQIYQRAIMATVAQAYAAGREIFDHSFQGRAVGEENQRRFLSLNAKTLRSQIAADINGAVAVASQVGRVVAPGAVSPVPAALQVSEGSLSNFINGGFPAVAGETETVAQYVARLGLVPGDLFTFVAFVIRPGAPVLFTLATDDTDYSKQFGCEFVYARYAVKDSAFSSTATNFTSQDVLELTDSNFNPLNWTDVPGESDTAPSLTLLVAPAAKGSYAWIHSRINEDLRSTETMSFDEADGEFTWGIASQFALAAWLQGTEQLGNSDLILEGGEI